MAVVARGSVAGQAFARTVYTIARKRFSGDFALVEHGMNYRITWREGLVVAANSQNPADSAARVALTAGLLTTTQVAEVLHKSAREPGRSQVQLIARMAGLSDKQQSALARRALLQQAMRTFALPEARFELDARAVSPNTAGGVVPLAVRTLIFHGLSAHYDLARLEAEMAVVAGAHFQLRKDDDVRQRLAEYGFTEAHVACVRQLASKPMTVAGLAKALPGTAHKDILLTAYALLSTDDVKARRRNDAGSEATVKVPQVTLADIADDPPKPAPKPPVPPGLAGRRGGRRTTLPPHLSDGVPRPPPPDAARLRSDESRPINIPASIINRARKNARSSGRKPGRARDRARDRASDRGNDRVKAVEIGNLIETRLRELDGGSDYYQLLGVARGVDDAGVRRAYFDLAKQLHPDRLRALGIDDDKGQAQRLFATVNKAFAVLGKAEERARYDTALSRGETGDQSRDRLEAEKQAMKLVSAEEHFLRGEQALRGNRLGAAQDEFARAVELNPDEAEHHALLAWATWCNAEDKDAVRTQVRQGLQRALQLSPKCVPAYFYRGQIASAGGDQKRALEDFRHVLKLQPSHREAELQVRLIESRMARTAGKRGRKR